MSRNFKDLKLAKSKITKRTRKGLEIRVNGRSTDFIAPGLGTGCQLACVYCYVARHRQFGNPLEQYTNWEEIWNSIYSHYSGLGTKIKNQCHSTRWTYDIGESTDCLLPINISGTNFIINKFLTFTEAMPSFATKICNLTKLEPCSKPRQARIRFSLMPQIISSIVEPGTSPIRKRIEAANLAYDMGYEVHFNFSPVILYKGWESHYKELFKEIKEVLNPVVLEQLKFEVIFLTHSPILAKKNDWALRAEKFLTVPQLQEYKTNLRGDSNVLRYKASTVKKEAINKIKVLIFKEFPNNQIRYIF